MKTRKIVVSAAILAGAMMANAASLTLTKGNVYTRSSSAVYPQPLSGITYAGGNSYYTVSDNGATYGLYTCTINLSEDGKTINSFHDTNEYTQYSYYEANIFLIERVILEQV